MALNTNVHVGGLKKLVLRDPLGVPLSCCTIGSERINPCKDSPVFSPGSADHDYAYDYPYYTYGDSYYDNGSCYVVQRRVHAAHGWRLFFGRCGKGRVSDPQTHGCRGPADIR